MPEATNDRAQNPEARRGVMTPDHGITITEVHLPAGTPLRASCLCGWQSPIVPSRPQAKAHADVHDSEVAREHARTVRESIEGRGVSSLDTPYLDQVAQAIAERICTRGVILDVDELAAIAAVLECSAADLLPCHLEMATR